LAPRHPEPMLAVDSRGPRKHLAVARHRIDDRLRHHALPFLLGGELIDVTQQVVLNKIVKLLAGVELHGSWRGTADGAVDGGRAGVDPAGNRGVDPDTACLRELLGEYLPR